MILFVKLLGEKQYHTTYSSNGPHIKPKKGWRKGMKYTTWSGDVFIIDSVDVHKKSGELRLHATQIK